jgi:transcriptional regulator with XRE-family HTH domain
MRSKMTREERHVARGVLDEALRRGELVLPEAIRQIRHSLGLNQGEFAKLFRLTRRQISELENGVGDPKLSTLTRIARVFGMSVGFLPKPPTSAAAHPPSPHPGNGDRP